ncbi:prephenate dehydratase [Thermodesulfobacteriota bacterium]
MSEEFVVSFSGERGAFSEEAVKKHYGPDIGTLPCHSFEEIFQAVENGRASFGAIPVENSTAGSINKAYDLLLEHDLKIWGEILLRVRHNLMAVPGTKLKDIRVVRSHPQALAQCEQYINRHGWQAQPLYDTAGCAKDLADNPSSEVAVIAGKLAAEIYGLNILASGVEDLTFNYTRFFFVGQGDPPHCERAKTSLIFSTVHTPGALVDSLSEFSTRGINLTKLESRPRRNRPWNYVFYLDFEGHWQDDTCNKALVALLARAAFVKLLGSYPAAVIPDEEKTSQRELLQI